MFRGQCPICAKRFEIASIDDLPSFPFCSDRCRLIDLGRWIDGDYVINSGTDQPETTTPSGDPDATGED